MTHTDNNEREYLAERERVGMAWLLVTILNLGGTGDALLMLAIQRPQEMLPALWGNMAETPGHRLHLLTIARGHKRPSWTAEASRLYAFCDWTDLPDEVRARLIRQIPEAATRAVRLLADDEQRAELRAAA